MLGRLFGRAKVDTLEATGGAARLAQAVRAELPDADEATARIVTAMTGLLGCVAYSDKDYSEAEEARVIRDLSRIHGLSDKGVRAICAVLRDHIVEIAAAETVSYGRDLVELADHDLRLQVLDVLVDLAAADEDISVRETNVLRRATQALALSQDDYNASQSRHRQKLSVLK
jgi:uncharacterized tellurite resistance protein B-like protein